MSPRARRRTTAVVHAWPRGANDQRSASSSPSSMSSAIRAFEIVASIFARLRMMPASPIRRSTSPAPKAATAAGSNPANTSRNRGRLRRIVIHDRPAWKPSRLIFSKSARSPCSGLPPLLVVVAPVLGVVTRPRAPRDAVASDAHVAGRDVGSSLRQDRRAGRQSGRRTSRGEDDVAGLPARDVRVRRPALRERVDAVDDRADPPADTSALVASRSPRTIDALRSPVNAIRERRPRDAERERVPRECAECRHRDQVATGGAQDARGRADIPCCRRRRTRRRTVRAASSHRPSDSRRRAPPRDRGPARCAAALQTAVTSAPMSTASWTAAVPTAPDAPLMRIRSPGWSRAVSRRNDMRGRVDEGCGIRRRESRRGGARPRRPRESRPARRVRPSRRRSRPTRASPTAKRVTPSPTAATVPAKSAPSTGRRGLRRPANSRAANGDPDRSAASAVGEVARLDADEQLSGPGRGVGKRRPPRPLRVRRIGG